MVWVEVCSKIKVLEYNSANTGADLKLQLVSPGDRHQLPATLEEKTKGWTDAWRDGRYKCYSSVLCDGPVRNSFSAPLLVPCLMAQWT